MITVLDNLKQTCVIISEFIAILGPDLMAVTGSVDQIDDKLEKVTQERRKLEDFPRDIFQPNNAEQWDATFKNFLNQIQTIDTQVVSLIDNTFSEKLNSSEGAFDLLAKFQNVKTRDAIKSLLTKKYEAVLKTYQKELNQMEELFKYGKAAPPIPKNMPPRAGEIAWARSIMGRIKAPIKKFKTKADQLTSKTFKEVALNYVRLAKELDENYEKKIFEKWEHENTMLALNLLGKNILKKDKQGVYKV
jgi:dynein heavy chain